MTECKLCRFASRAMGGRIVMPIVCRKSKKIFLEDIQEYTRGLELKIVGGLSDKGYTRHDIDVVGNKKHLPLFIKRLKENSINNPIHYCGGFDTHSHLECIFYGLKLVFTGKGY